MTALIVIGWIAAYLTVGAVYARSQAVACYERARRQATEEWGRFGAHGKEYLESSTRERFRVKMAFRVALWWLFPLIAVGQRGDGLFMGPVVARQRQADQLRADAAAWRDKQHSGTPAEREMAAELARLCEQQAREVDL